MKASIFVNFRNIDNDSSSSSYGSPTGSFDESTEIQDDPKTDPNFKSRAKVDLVPHGMKTRTKP